MLKRKKSISSRSLKHILSLVITRWERSMIDWSLVQALLMKRVLALIIKRHTNTGKTKVKLRSLRPIGRECSVETGSSRILKIAWRSTRTTTTFSSSMRVIRIDMMPGHASTERKVLKSSMKNMEQSIMPSTIWPTSMTRWIRITTYTVSATTSTIGIQRRTMRTIPCL